MLELVVVVVVVVAVNVVVEVVVVIVVVGTASNLGDATVSATNKCCFFPFYQKQNKHFMF